ncbi:ribosomal-protein-alanine N-acetyltransferase [Povalibacter uvarum]|uniref:Ribosomal-protein-alanine N-acetyltransferase n=1 Tax=Povalibacter uvarum TaxID=732238 RepID=A0A841HLA4_9GAMM|nr:GNAT family N-acetyltransferase [Povalibacter uvarum]MBB6092902.1 ribosomal-protein-alanine N-acetyltransferase [Povalibacter uvarum]
MFPELDTPRLRLTRIHPEDANAVFELFSDPKVVEYYDLEPFSAIAEAEKLMALFESRYSSGSGIRWAIRERESADLIGTCGFNTWSQKMRNGVIGYDLRPSHWGRGMVTEAIAAMLHAAFTGTLPCGPLHRIQADTILGNTASERVLLKLGFREEGIRRHAAFLHGAYKDMKCFGLLAET